MAATASREAQAAEAEVLRLEAQLSQACDRVRAAEGTKTAATAGMSALVFLQTEDEPVQQEEPVPPEENWGVDESLLVCRPPIPMLS